MDLGDCENLMFVSVSKKLQLLDCTLLGNGEEWWLYELLLTPGIHRYQLFEWILSKLKFNSLKTLQLQNSPDEHAKNLLPILADLGLCRNTDGNLILGKSSKTEQLMFWEKLLDILWEKLKHSRKLSAVNTSEEEENENESNPITVETTKDLQLSVDEKYKKNCDLMRSVFSGVNVNELLMEKVDVLPMDVKKESMKTDYVASSGICNLDDLKSGLKSDLNNGISNFNSVVFSNSLESFEEEDFILESVNQKAGEENLRYAVAETCSLVEDFSQFYKDLKSFLKSESIYQSDIGLYFKILHLQQSLISKVLTDLSQTKSCYFKLHEGSEVGKIKSSNVSISDDDSATLSCSSLQSYVSVLQNRLKLLQNDGINGVF